MFDRVRSSASSAVWWPTSRRTSPPENAAIVCRHFLAQVRRERCRCRPLVPEDLSTVPFARGAEGARRTKVRPLPGLSQLDERGRSFGLERFQTGMSIPELRWSCRYAERADECHAVSVEGRDRMPPALRAGASAHANALALHERLGDASVTVLRAELRRVQESPIVLNRGTARSGAGRGRAPWAEHERDSDAVRAGQARRGRQ